MIWVYSNDFCSDVQQTNFNARMSPVHVLIKMIYVMENGIAKMETMNLIKHAKIISKFTVADLNYSKY